MRVVRRGLKPPLELTGIDVQRNDGFGIEVRPLAALAGDHRLRISGADIEQAEVGVVGAGHPGHPAPMHHGFDAGPGFGFRGAGLGMGVPAPFEFACFRIVRFQIPGDIEVIAADAGNHVIAGDDRRDRGVVELAEVADFGVPLLFAVGDVERDEIAIGRFDVDRIAPHSDPAIADVPAALRFPAEVPQLASGARIDGIDVIRQRGEQDAVHDDGRTLDGRGVSSATALRTSAEARPVDPGERHRIDIVLVDLIEWRVAAAGIVSVIGRPVLGARGEKLCGIEVSLCQRGCREDSNHRGEDRKWRDEPHWTDSR